MPEQSLQLSLASLTASLASHTASLASLTASLASRTALAALRSSRSQSLLRPQSLSQPHPQLFLRLPHEFPQELPPPKRSNNIIQQFILQYLHSMFYCIVFRSSELLFVQIVRNMNRIFYEPYFLRTNSWRIQRKVSSSPHSANIFSIFSSTPLVYSCIMCRFFPFRKYS